MRPFVHEALPGRVVFGAGSIDQVPAEVAGLGDPRRVMVVASGSSGAVGERVAEALGPRFAASFGEVRQHVPEALAATATETAGGLEADAVVTVGGGSAIGLGKVIAADRDIPLLAVPTTYSGSEMTPTYGVTGTQKRTVRDPRALPKVVVYDPELTVDLPARVSASSGMNALAHAVEGLYAAGANPVVSLWAEEAIWQLAAALPAVTSAPSDVEARAEALYGAYLSGATLAVAGIALHHKLCHVLGGRFGLNHADVHAVLLPHVAAFNASAAPEAMGWAAVAFGAGTREPDEVGGCVHDLATKIGAPTSLASIGMPEDGLDEAAALGVAAVGTSNPRPVDERAARELLQAAYEGRRP
ncbi:MAG: maleylacetate reductase [Acidimicrobiales bacterium]